MAIDLRPSRRIEPRGFDEDWATNAAEIEQLRSPDFGAPLEPHPVVPERPLDKNARRKQARAPLTWLTVIAGGAAVGGLLFYLLITLARIGPAEPIARQTDVPAKRVDAAHKVSRSGSGAASTVEDQRRMADKGVAEEPIRKLSNR